MILVGEIMNKTRSCSFFLISLFLLSICSISVNADNDNEINEDNFSSLVTGYSKFIIHDDIITNSQFNSTWEFSITLSVSYTHLTLPTNREV